MMKMDEMDKAIDTLLHKEFMEEEKQFLKEEKKKNGKKYLYGCPYCNYQSHYFHQVSIHIAKNEKCANSHRHSPCYPILLHTSDGTIP